MSGCTPAAHSPGSTPRSEGPAHERARYHEDGETFEPSPSCPAGRRRSGGGIRVDRRTPRHVDLRHDGVRPRLLAAPEPARVGARGRPRRRRRRRRDRSATPWSAPRPGRFPPATPVSRSRPSAGAPTPGTPRPSTSRSRCRSIPRACRPVSKIFSIHIPLLPSFTLNPQIEGTFRCEPV